MRMGVIEVTLVDARGLSNTEFGGIDPYVVIQYKGQEHESTIARGQGSTPKWNEKYTFRAEYPGSGGQYKLILKIMDHDTFSEDDYVGEATIYLKEILELGVEQGTAEIHPQKYSVVDGSQSYRGEIRVGITFTSKVQKETDAGEYGGWKQSQY